MTGRDIIMLILENKLEDVELLVDGKLPGFISVEEAAVKFEVGTATVEAWVNKGHLSHVKIRDKIYIPENAVPDVIFDDWSALWLAALVKAFNKEL